MGRSKAQRKPPPNHPARKTKYDLLNNPHCDTHPHTPYAQSPCRESMTNSKFPLMSEKECIEYINEIRGANSEEMARMQREMLVREQMATEQRWIRLCFGITAFLLMAMVVNQVWVNNWDEGELLIDKLL